MDLSRERIAATYAAMSEPELMEIARSYDSLTEMAQESLRQEFSRRKLEPPLIEEEDEVERQWVTIRRYRDLSEAIVARSMLEANGITVYLKDENLVRLEWQVSNGIGGIRLQVDAEDTAQAEELLGQPVPETIELGEMKNLSSRAALPVGLRRSPLKEPRGRRH